ncbi:MAG TPA: hypothetical protein VI874_01510 [Candidatus Norongarragalinales archaeon]|nr:hypothetical protein [Candidatus Norongarragalinales archaeon]
MANEITWTTVHRQFKAHLTRLIDGIGEAKRANSGLPGRLQGTKVTELTDHPGLREVLHRYGTNLFTLKAIKPEDGPGVLRLAKGKSLTPQQAHAFVAKMGEKMAEHGIKS